MTLDFSNINVLTVGDSMIDEYVYGVVTRISPEAPIPILEFTNSKLLLGGAANVALNVKSLGAQSGLVSISGVDKNATHLENLAVSNDISVSLISDNSRPTTHKKRFISQTQQILRVDKEKIHYPSTEISLKIVQTIKERHQQKNIDVLILQDYNKGLLSPAIISQLISWCNQNKVISVVDPKFKNVECYKDCYAIKPNKAELEHFTSIAINKDLSNIYEVSKQLHNSLNPHLTFVTLGNQGLYNHQTCQVAPAEKVLLSDVTGAGDSVIAALALAIKSDLNMLNINKLCLTVGAISVSHQGCYAVPIKEVIDKLS